MFDKKYITRGINSEIPLYLQLLMWDMIKSMKVEKQGYLQVFKLERVIAEGKVFQKITHSQEQPEYENILLIPAYDDKAVDNKVFVIDDYEYCTMLLAEEY